MLSMQIFWICAVFLIRCLIEEEMKTELKNSTLFTNTQQSNAILRAKCIVNLKYVLFIKRNVQCYNASNS